MLKTGIVMIGFALVVALFVPKLYGGLLITCTLLVLGMSLVIVAPYHDRARTTQDLHAQGDDDAEGQGQTHSHRR